jgi:hypothetical protein
MYIFHGSINLPNGGSMLNKPIKNMSELSPLLP